jgi:hypothetical protein
VTRTAAILAIVLVWLSPQEKQKAYRLPSTDLKQRIIWGSTCEVPGGPSLAFGGQDQQGDDGNPHTRIKVDGEWMSITEELRKKNAFQKIHDRCRTAADLQKEIAARTRSAFLQGRGGDTSAERDVVGTIDALLLEWPDDAPAPSRRAKEELQTVRAQAVDVNGEVTPLMLKAMSILQVELELAAEGLDAEPAARALSPIAYDEKTRLFVLFGGDHLDYLTNDTWVFDPEKRRWFQRHPKEAPSPRANHQLKAAQGRVTLTGGYAYTSSTDYVGGQYRDHNDGEWTYDVTSDTWTGSKGVAPETRVYRTGRLHPDFYLEGPRPDPAAFAKVLAGLPANLWVNAKPPQLPALNRDWGTAVLDPDRNLILRWSGGHSAHGGTDVLQYHIDTNRWELPFPVEFPLGQLYSNTEYPDGWNFNRRPWVTGHTYQNYGYDPNLKKMLFTGRRDHCYVWDSDLGDWTGRFAKPKAMVYGDCFYTLTLTPTPAGLVCWTNGGKLFRFAKTDWIEIPLKGEKLPGSVVDNSTVVYDSKRERLLFARKQYGDKTQFDGLLQACDLKTGEVTVLSPAGKEGASEVSYLCQLRYDSANDLVLAGCTMTPDADGFRRTAAYDCAGNRWISLKIAGDDPSGKKGRSVSLGMMYDAQRKLFWAVDTNSNVFVLRLNVATADLKPL